MGKYASKVVAQAKAWLGLNESNGGHKEIIDIYNSQRPLPRGYKLTLRDPWCAGFTTAVAVKLGYTDIIPCECSCSRLIALAKEMGIWVEDESVTPKLGWLALYDWNDNGKGDNKGDPEHVGYVAEVSGGKIYVVEGNYDGSDADKIDGVEVRPLEINGKFLRGYIAPKYDEEETVDTPPVNKIEEDGLWGEETTTRLQQIFGTPVDGVVSNQWECYKKGNPGLVSGFEWLANPNGNGSPLIKKMQKWAGMPAKDQDGEIGPDTIKAVQRKLGTTVDGKVSYPSQMVKALQKWANEQ